jgi:ABC-type phosphate transport system substrate-binding protein
MRYFLLSLGLLVMPMVFAQDQPLTLIANASVSISAPLSIESIKEIYLLKQLNWPDKTPIIVINRKSTHSARKIFEHKLGLSSTKYALYLKKMHYKGMSLPIIQESKQAVLAFVEKVPGSIAYIEGKPPSEMKNIKVIGLLR